MTVLGFDHLKQESKNDPNFQEIYVVCENLVSRYISPWIEDILKEGLTIKGIHLCIPRCSMRDNLLQEKHGGGLVGHFVQDKTYAQLSSFYYWPSMREDIKTFVEKCRVCQYAKGRNKNAILYYPLPIPSRPCVVVSMDLVLGLPKTERGHEFFFVVDIFSKWLILYHVSRQLI